jgi:hypothetical protein
MNDTDQYAELTRMLAALGAGISRLTDRLDRIEEHQTKTAALVREINGDKPTRRKFRPLDLSNRIQG